MYQRELANEVIRGLKQFPAIVLTGPRRAGKTFLLKKELGLKTSYYLLEDPDVLLRVKSDPRAWLESIKTPAIIDEIQNAPELLPYIRTIIDSAPSKKGQWLITGSQEFSIMKGVTESLAGRAGIFSLLPFSWRETRKTSPFFGGYPEVINHPRSAKNWFRSYLQTYIEQDIRQIINVKDMGTYRRFLQILANNNGQVLNKSDIAAPVGVKVPTITQWLSALEITNQIVLIQPYFNNFKKRLIKSPKLYWLDSGLLCFLLGIESEKQLNNHPAAGFIFESYLASEILKNQINRGEQKSLYYFRDEFGLEVDLIQPIKSGLRLIEVKWSKTPVPSMVSPLLSLKKNIPSNIKTELCLVHRGDTIDDSTLTSGVKAFNYKTFLNK